jgi:hypothetical protein
MPAARYKLLGKYRTPTFRYGQRVDCLARGEVRIRELCQRYVDEQWVAAHMTDQQAAESLLDQFKRAVRAEME